jgi:translation initiation factor 3 subunit D
MFDRITSKSDRALTSSEKRSFNVTPQEDPVLLALAQDTPGRVVVTSSAILAALMCCTRSVYSWDLIVTKRGNTIFLDKRSGGPLDFLTVNENATEPPVDGGEKDINSPQALASEATNINRHYSECILKEVWILLW